MVPLVSNGDRCPVIYPTSFLGEWYLPGQCPVGADAFLQVGSNRATLTTSQRFSIIMCSLTIVTATLIDVLALLPVNECACACRTKCTSANRIYSVGAYSVLESACTVNPSCFQYDWDETGDARSPFKNDLSNAMCVSCMPSQGLVAKKGCKRFTSLAARLCCVSLLRCLCCLPIGFAFWV